VPLITVAGVVVVVVVVVVVMTLGIGKSGGSPMTGLLNDAKVEAASAAKADWGGSVVMALATAATVEAVAVAAEEAEAEEEEGWVEAEPRREPVVSNM
jgi:hypothetical protein